MISLLKWKNHWNIMVHIIQCYYLPFMDIYFFVLSYNLYSLMRQSMYISYNTLYICMIFICIYQITLQGNSWYNTFTDRKLMTWSYRMCPYYRISCSKSEIFLQPIKQIQRNMNHLLQSFRNATKVRKMIYIS